MYRYLRTAHDHPTAEQVFHAVKSELPNISLATVYNVLDTLVSAGLANRIAVSNGAFRFDCRSDSHYHLRCMKTGEVRDVALPFDETLLDKLDPAVIDLLRQHGFVVTGYSLELRGHFANPAQSLVVGGL